MAKKKTKKVYVLDNGERYDVTGEDGRYIFCDGNTQFRKSAKRGKIVREPIEEETEEETAAAGDTSSVLRSPFLQEESEDDGTPQPSAMQTASPQGEAGDDETASQDRNEDAEED